MTAISIPISTQDPSTIEALREVLPIASKYADEVDRNARFPVEALDALRAARALSWLIPIELGGEGYGLDFVSEAACHLSRYCSATGMTFAMHQIQIACLVRHGLGSPWIREYLGQVAKQQRLIASATSEVGVGGNVRESIASLISLDDSPTPAVSFEKNASTISYGAHADDLLTTVRRAPDVDRGDQVLVLTKLSETDLLQTTEWDTLGMRGTCSPGFTVRATCSPDQILPAPFARIAAETMVPVSHVLWSHVWLGIASDAFERAQKFVRVQARQKPGTVPPAGAKLSELSVHIAQFRNLVKASLHEYMKWADEEGRKKLSTIGFAIHTNNLKIAASEAVIEVCQGALRVCGIAGYKNTGPYSIGRHLRDANSGVLMVANDRLQATNAALLLVHRD